MNKLIQDLRYGIRTLLKRPGFSIIAIATLAIGIGASTTIFTVVNAALLRGLPYKQPDRLYHLWERPPRQDFSKREMSYPDYLDYQKNNVFDGIAAYTGGASTQRMFRKDPTGIPAAYGDAIESPPTAIYEDP